MRFIIDAMDVSPEAVCYATFTGKAAEVLHKKGNQNTMTLHKLLYDNVMLPVGGYMRIPKKQLEYTVIVVDEVSMVPREMIELLFSHKCYVICLGDPFQLPPIDQNTDNHLLDKPHVFLDEIMRQATESDIIRISMDIRAHRNLNLFSGNDVKVITQQQYERDMLTWADQVIVATNYSRINCNDCVRQMMGRSEYPEDGDKVVCLKNYWETFTELNGDALVNGTIGFLSDPILKVPVSFPRWLRIETNPVYVISSDIVTEDSDVFNHVFIDQQRLIEGEDSLIWNDFYKLSRQKYKIGDKIPKTFDYGYAITCHKAQGSQWQKVFILEESFPFKREEHARWLYTAITRAEKEAIIVRN